MLKNKLINASFILSIISIVSLVVIAPLSLFFGFTLLMVAFGEQIVGPYEPSLWKTIVGVTIVILFYFPIIIAGITGILGLAFGIIGTKRYGSKKKLTIGIILSSITIVLGIVILLLWVYPRLI